MGRRRKITQTTIRPTIAETAAASGVSRQAVHQNKHVKRNVNPHRGWDVAAAGALLETFRALPAQVTNSLVGLTDRRKVKRILSEAIEGGFEEYLDRLQALKAAASVNVQ